MSEFVFGIRIAGKNDTGSALRSVTAGFQSALRVLAKPIVIPLQIARGGLGLLRDINLGLRPAIAAIDNLIDKGSALEVVKKSFESLTHSSAAGADVLARKLVNAASGTVKLAEAMQIANRALGSGLSLQQLGVAMEFISKKAISTGKDAGESLEKVITGLSRGSTLFLDDFGILVDGIDGVRRSFDKIHGSNAFDALGPAAQKAETIRQAIAEMAQQTSRIGVTGRETVFVWQQIKNGVSDSVDKLVLAIVKSKALGAALREFRGFLAGVTEHFEGGGTFGQLLTGKKDKDGKDQPGLLDVIGAGAMDLAENMGRGILGGMLKGAAALGDLWPKFQAMAADAGVAFVDKVVPKISDWFTSYDWPALGKKIGTAIVDVIKGSLRFAGAFFKDVTSGGADEAMAADANANANRTQVAMNRAIAKKQAAARQRSGESAQRDQLFGRGGISGLGFGQGFGVDPTGAAAGPSVFGIDLEKTGNDVLGGIGWGRAAGAWSRFRSVFGGKPENDPDQVSGARDIGRAKENLVNLGLVPSHVSQRGRIAANMKVKAAATQYKKAVLDSDLGTRTQAETNTREIVRQRIRDGFEVDGAERAAIYNAEYKRLNKDRRDNTTRQLQDAIKTRATARALPGRIADFEREGRGAIADKAHPDKAVEFTNKVGELIDQVKALVGALGVSSGEIANAR